MKRETALTNARVVLPDREIDGTVVLSGGEIARVEEGRSSLPTAQDMEGGYLIPGLVELHTDNLEGHLAPRPSVHWPTLPALMAHDAQVAAAGITTVFDAVRIGDRGSDTYRVDRLRETVEQIAGAQDRGQLRAAHLLHLRCEVSVENVTEHFAQFCENPLLRLVSLMDHTPGQRQFIDLRAFKTYYQGRYRLGDAEIEEVIRTQTEDHRRHAADNRVRLTQACRALALRIASHDDATVEHVEEAAGLGLTISEFPTTLDAARAARRHGMTTVAGAPNVVRGVSHSGNVAARDLAADGLIDALSSDYVPVSLLHGVFVLHRRIGLALSDAVAIVSRNPARMVGLEDRGEIVPGQRADLVHVTVRDDVPTVLCVWREGRRIA